MALTTEYKLLFKKWDSIQFDAKYNHIKYFVDDDKDKAFAKVLMYHCNRYRFTYYLDYAVEKGDLNLVKWFCEQSEENYIPRILDIAIKHGHSNIINYCFDNKKNCQLTLVVLDYAIANGYFEFITDYLINKNNWMLNTTVLTYAAKNGHLDLVKYLDESDIYPNITRAMPVAAKNGHLDIFIYLYKSKEYIIDVTDVTDAINHAAKNGHLHIIEWMNENVEEGWTTDAMDEAAANGHLHILKYLCKNRKEGCTQKAMTYAFEYAKKTKSFKTMEWLYRNMDLILVDLHQLLLV